MTTVDIVTDCDMRALLERRVHLRTLESARVRAEADVTKANAAWHAAKTRAAKLDAQHAHGEACRALRAIRKERDALGVVR
jgi:hypothetical protein